MKEEYQDRIENYLLNRMSDTDRLTFEQELEKDAELRDQYEFVRMVKTALMLENIDNDVNEWTKAHKKREEASMAAQEVAYKATGSGYECTVAPDYRTYVSPRSSKRHVIYWISGIAAVLIVVFFMYGNLGVYNAAPSNRNAVAYNPHPQGISTVRGVDATVETLLAHGFYQKALSRIETLEEEIAADLLVIERQKESRGSYISYKGTDRKTFKDTQRMDLIRKGYEIEKEQSNDNIDEITEMIIMLNYRQEGLLLLKVETLIRLNRMEEARSLIPRLDKIRQSKSEFKEKADSLYYVLKK